MEKEEIRNILLEEIKNFIASYKNDHTLSADKPFNRRACAERLEIFRENSEPTSAANVTWDCPAPLKVPCD